MTTFNELSATGGSRFFGGILAKVRQSKSVGSAAQYGSNRR